MFLCYDTNQARETADFALSLLFYKERCIRVTVSLFSNPYIALLPFPTKKKTRDDWKTILKTCTQPLAEVSHPEYQYLDQSPSRGFEDVKRNTHSVPFCVLKLLCYLANATPAFFSSVFHLETLNWLFVHPLALPSLHKATSSTSSKREHIDVFQFFFCWRGSAACLVRKVFFTIIARDG